MNKMNLPPPFEELDAEFPMLKEVYDMEKFKDIFGKNINIKTKFYIRMCKQQSEIEFFKRKLYSCFIPGTLDESINEQEENESEMESDGEDNVRPQEIIPIKRKRPQSTKRLKIPKFVNPAKTITTSLPAQKVLKPEDMFESIQFGETKNLKIELKTVDKLLDVASASQDTAVAIDGGFGLIFPTNKVVEDSNDSEEKTETQKNKFISTEELEANRISINDQRVLPVFKNYHPGKASNRLYIKNLGKQVETKDLDYIYKRYIIAGLKNAENE